MISAVYRIEIMCIICDDKTH